MRKLTLWIIAFAGIINQVDAQSTSQCTPGTNGGGVYWDGSSCQPCPEGKFMTAQMHANNEPSCADAQPGYQAEDTSLGFMTASDINTQGYGANQEVACPTGYYNGAVGGGVNSGGGPGRSSVSKCYLVEPGYQPITILNEYTDGANGVIGEAAVAQGICGANEFQDVSGGTYECLTADDGYEPQDANGDYADGTQCISGDANSAQSNYGDGCAVDQSQCPFGEFSNQGDECAAVQPGYEPRDNTGSYTSGTGAVNEYECDPGFFSLGGGPQCQGVLGGHEPQDANGNPTLNGATQQVKCQPGEHSTGMTACAVATDGYEPQDSSGNYADGTSCVTAAGPTQGQGCASQQGQCSGTFSSGGNQCATADDGKQPTDASGTYQASGATHQTACPTNTFSIGGDPCATADDGKQPTDASGTYQNSGATHQTACPTGTFSQGGGPCLQADDGKQPTNGAGGAYTASGATHQTACPTGTFSQGGNQCATADDGKQPTNGAGGAYTASGATHQTACPTNTFSSGGNQCATADDGKQPTNGVGGAYTASGATHQTACPTGTFSQGGGPCLQAADGKQPTNGAGGAYTASGATHQTDCPITTFSSGGNQCATADDGSMPTDASGNYQNSGATHQTACIQDTYSSGGNQCAAVSTGKFPADAGGAYTASGATQDLDCFSTAPVTCDTCVGPLASDCRSGKCSAGNGRDDSKWNGGVAPFSFECVACTNPQYSDTDSADACADLACPIGEGQKDANTHFGYVYDPSGDESVNCAACPTDTFSGSATTGQCTAVTAGFHAANNGGTYVATAAVQEVVCPAGTFNNDGTGSSTVLGGNGGCSREWTACAKGSSVTVAATTTADRTCDPCAPGTFSSADVLAANVGTTSVCTDVDPGKEAIDDASPPVYDGNGGAVGQRACTGQYSVADATSGKVEMACTSCAKGYEFVNTQSLCTACNVNEYQPAANAASPQCQTVPAGKLPIDSNDDYVRSAAEAIIDCPAGTYNDGVYGGSNLDAGSTSTNKCAGVHSACPLGFGLNRVANTSHDGLCEACPNGQYSDDITAAADVSTATEPCKDIPAGHEGQDGNGYVASGAEQTAACDAGEFNTNGFGPCLDTGAGNFTADASGNHVTTQGVQQIACPSGEYNLAVSGKVSQACKNCTAGFEFAGAGTACTACTTDKYQSYAVRNAQCVDVDPGFHAANNADLYVSSQAVKQFACKAGTWNNDGKGGTVGSTGCDNDWAICPAGQFASVLATTTNAATCSPCADGFFKATPTPKMQTNVFNNCTQIAIDFEAVDASDVYAASGAVDEEACEIGEFNDQVGPCEDCVSLLGSGLANDPSLCERCHNGTNTGCYQGECGAGYGKDLDAEANGFFACELCADPFFNLELSADACAETMCDPGTGQKDPNTHTFDPTKDKSENCAACPKDTFSNSSKSGQCNSVHPGYYAGRNDSNAYTESRAYKQYECAPGTWNTDGSGRVRSPTHPFPSGCSQDWTECQAGYYIKRAATTKANRECVICPSGKYNPNDVAAINVDTVTQCLDIPDGHEGHNASGVYNPIGAVSAVACRAGTFEPNGDGECEKVEPGKEAQTAGGAYAATGAVQQSFCGQGLFNIPDADGFVSTNCQFCAAGTEFTSGTSACSTCDAGKFQPSNTKAPAICDIIGAGFEGTNGLIPASFVATGAKDRRACVGSAYNDDGIGRCSVNTWKSCGRGYKVVVAASSKNDRVCERCPEGRFRNQITSSNYLDPVNVNTTNTCDDVPAGSYGAKVDGITFQDVVATDPGAVMAVACPTNTYNADGDGACTPSSVGKHAANATDFFVETGAVKEVDCPHGTFNTDGTGGQYGEKGCSQLWQDCPAGTFVSSVASATTGAVCTDCPAGEFKSTVSLATNVNSLSFCDPINVGYQGQDGPLVTDNFVSTAASHQVACRAGTFSSNSTRACQIVQEGFRGVDTDNEFADSAAVGEQACLPGLFNFMDEDGMVSTDCQYCAAGTEFMGQTEPCRECVTGTFQPDNTAANAKCQECALDKETVNVTSGEYISRGASGCIGCGKGELSIRWKCDVRICQCDNGPAAVGVDCPAHGAYRCADGSCIHPDTFLHVLKGKSVNKVRAGELRSGDLVIGEDATSSVQRVERFSVADKGCVVPENLCKDKLTSKIVLSRNHAVRCPEWPVDNWMFCQEDWERESVREYVHVELENYMTDHLLSDSVVLESWDGYKRTTDEAGASCETGCPWPHDWEQSKMDPRKHIRVDLRKPTNIDMRRMREGREVADTGIKILRSYLAK